MNLTDKAALRELFASGGIEVTDEQYGKLERYAGLLVEWNGKMHLTAITDPQGIAEKHFYDSVYPFLSEGLPAEGASLADIGTGAGFPSCPLGIFRPDLRLTLIDSLNKRVGFLQELTSALGLTAECIHGRAEELGRKEEYRERFDIVTARAVAALPVLCEYCLPFVKVGGIFAALKGSDGAAELRSAANAVKTLGGGKAICREYTLPNGDGRSLILIKKLSPAPPKYPRNKGRMDKSPL